MSDENNNHEIEQPLIRIVHRAMAMAHDMNHEYCTVEHLLSSVMKEDMIISLMKSMNVDHDAIFTKLDEFFKSDLIEKTSNRPETTTALEETMFVVAGRIRFSNPTLSPQFLVLLQILHIEGNDCPATMYLKNAGMTEIGVKKYLSGLQPSNGESKKMTASPTGEIENRESAELFLMKYCANLNKDAAMGKIDKLIGRKEEVQKAIQIFCRKKKNNPLLIGDPGTGKTAIVEGMAAMIVADDVPEVMKGTVIYSLNLGSLLAGTKYRGDFEERIDNIMKAMTYVPSGILFIDETHMIMGAGSASGSTDAANLLKPALSSGSLRVIGSTTFEEYRKYFEKDRALMRRFGKINITEPSVSETKDILRGLVTGYAEHHNVTYTDDALVAAAELTAKYVNSGMLPDKAIDIIDLAGSRKRTSGSENSIIDTADIEFEISRITNIPKQNIEKNENTQLINLENNIKKTVFGQEEAISTLVDSVFVSRAGLREEDKPQGNYLFVGPTGTGKTEVCKTLAKSLGIPLVKFDMSEYMERHSVSKLIGAPPGYKGFDEAGGSGELTNAIEENQHCVLLLDEIEKAHPSIYNILLQIMDDGKLTNSGGKTISFRNVIVIMTSNAGAAKLEKGSIGFNRNSKENNDDEVKKIFTPEFRNRLDAMIRFKRLSQDDTRKIAQKFIDDLNDMVADRGIKLRVHKSGYDWLTEHGYDALMGARPMKRLIYNEIKKPLSRMILVEKIAHGTTISITAKNDKLAINVK